MKGLLVLFIVAALFVTGEAFKCYECTFGNPSCNDPFDNLGWGVKQVEYPTGCYCSKLVVEMNGVTLTNRGCINVTQSCPTNTFDNVPRSVALYFCEDDLCNGSSSITATQFGLITSIITLIVTNWSRFFA